MFIVLLKKTTAYHYNTFMYILRLFNNNNVGLYL